jgi:hypothetical protein
MANDTAATKGKPRRVVHVMNITDVGHMTDDAEGGELGEDRMAVAGKRLLEQKKAGKLPADAKLDPSNPYDIARFYEMRFREDAKKLGLKLAIEAEKEGGARIMPRATENVERMKRMIAKLMERGHAYAAGQHGSRVVYFRVKSFGLYGRLSGETRWSGCARVRAGGVSGRINRRRSTRRTSSCGRRPFAHHEVGFAGGRVGAGVPGVAHRVLGDERGEPAGESGVRIDAGEGRRDRPGSSICTRGVRTTSSRTTSARLRRRAGASCRVFARGSGAGDVRADVVSPAVLLVEGTKMSKSKGNFFHRAGSVRGAEPERAALSSPRRCGWSSSRRTTGATRTSRCRG